MRRIFQLTALFVLTLWMPATVHCELETMLGMATEECCGHHAGDAAVPVDHCAVEEGAYRTSDSTIAVAAPAALLCWHGLEIVVQPPREALVRPWAPIDRPFELSRTWHFRARAALPARAPSLVS